MWHPISPHLRVKLANAPPGVRAQAITKSALHLMPPVVRRQSQCLPRGSPVRVRVLGEQWNWNRPAELSAVATFVVLLTRRHLKCILALSVRTLAWSKLSARFSLQPRPQSLAAISVGLLAPELQQPLKQEHNDNRENKEPEKDLQQDTPAGFLCCSSWEEGSGVWGGENKRELFWALLQLCP